MAKMSFAILRHAKIKSSTKGAAISHNHRLSEVEKININPALKHLNRSFLGDGAKDRIDAKLPLKMRKDAVISVETLLTASPEFFDGLEKDREKLAKNSVFLAWVDESLKWAKKEFGSNLVDAVLHMDESSPHIHILSVPLIDGRLCAKEVMARKELQRRQTEYFQAVKGFGLERGVPAAETKRRHIGLKEAPGSGGQASQLAAQLVQKQAELDRVQLDVGSEKANWAMREEFLKTRNEKIRGALVNATEKVETMETKITQLEADKAEMKALADKWAAKEAHYQAEKAAGTPAHLIDTTKVVATMPQEPSKSLLERLEEWVKGLVEKFGKKPVGLVEGRDYIGKVLEVMPGGGAWAQRTSGDGSWVVHEGKAPPLGAVAEVKFKGGVSQVKGMDNQFQQQKPGVAR